MNLPVSWVERLEPNKPKRKSHITQKWRGKEVAKLLEYAQDPAKRVIDLTKDEMQRIFMLAHAGYATRNRVRLVDPVLTGNGCLHYLQVDATREPFLELCKHVPFFVEVNELMPMNFNFMVRMHSPKPEDVWYIIEQLQGLPYIRHVSSQPVIASHKWPNYLPMCFLKERMFVQDVSFNPIESVWHDATKGLDLFNPCGDSEDDSS